MLFMAFTINVNFNFTDFIYSNFYITLFADIGLWHIEGMVNLLKFEPVFVYV